MPVEAGVPTPGLRALPGIHTLADPASPGRVDIPGCETLARVGAFQVGAACARVTVVLRAVCTLVPVCGERKEHR